MAAIARLDPQRGGRVVQLGLGSGGQRHGVAGVRQLERDRPADASTGAGHQTDPFGHARLPQAL